MSLLWPDIVHVGLYPGHAWAMHGREELATWSSSSRDELLAGFAEALVKLRRPKRRLRPPRVRVQVSDSFAAIVAVPWQPVLGKDEEWRAYALACFQSAGRTVDEDWLMHVEFRQPKCTGLAYALPKTWIDRLNAIVEEAGCVLEVVLPVSACVFTRRAAIAFAAAKTLVLEEMNQVTLLAFDRAGLVAYDIEPAIGGKGAALSRLLARHAGTVAIDYWTAGDDVPGLEGIIVTPLPARVWSRAL